MTKPSLGPQPLPPEPGTEPGRDIEYDRAAAELGRAVYLCLSCGYKWVSRPVPEDCNACGHPYVKWLNYHDRKW